MNKILEQEHVSQDLQESTNYMKVCKLLKLYVQTTEQTFKTDSSDSSTPLFMFWISSWNTAITKPSIIKNNKLSQKKRQPSLHELLTDISFSPESTSDPKLNGDQACQTKPHDNEPSPPWTKTHENILNKYLVNDLQLMFPIRHIDPRIPLYFQEHEAAYKQTNWSIKILIEYTTWCSCVKRWKLAATSSNVLPNLSIRNIAWYILLQIKKNPYQKLQTLTAQSIKISQNNITYLVGGIPFTGTSEAARTASRYCKPKGFQSKDYQKTSRKRTNEEEYWDYERSSLASRLSLAPVESSMASVFASKPAP